MKKNFLAAALAAMLIQNGWSLTVDSSAKGVRTVAIVSLYMNHVFANVAESKHAPQSVSLLDVVNKASGKNLKIPLQDNDADRAQRQALLDHAVLAYTDALSAGGRWQVLPAEGSSKKEAPGQNRLSALNQAFAEAQTEANWDVATGLVYVPTDKVTDKLRQSLAQTARDLGVDAVAVIHLDMGYRMANVQILSTEYAAPSILPEVLVVSKAGQLVAKDPGLLSLQRRFEGKTAPMVIGGRFTLAERDGKGLAAYKETIDKAAAKLKEQLSKKL